MIPNGKLKLFRKGKFLIALAIATAITVPVSVFAATSDTAAAKSIRGFFGIDSTKLTDQQKETVKNYSQKLADLQKEFIDSMVSNSAMTKEQGDEAKKKIDDNLNNNEANGFIPGFGGGRKGFEGSEKRGDFGIGGVELSKLTDAQKKDVLDSYKKMAGIQKEFINKMVTAGIMSKENGDAELKSIDDLLADLDKNGITEKAGGFMKGFYGFNCFKFFGAAGADTSKLTEEQKNILTDYSKQLADAQKELISKMVSNGAITKDQGDAASQKIDNMLNSKSETNFPMNGMMKRGRFGMHEKGNFNTSGAAIQSSAGSL